ncbi:hypothetical protein CARUB_v100079681mg, partial [Capsella rubella]
RAEDHTGETSSES